MFEFWAFLETNFVKNTCTLEAETYVGKWLNLASARFLLALTKTMRFWSDFLKKKQDKLLASRISIISLVKINS